MKSGSKDNTDNILDNTVTIELVAKESGHNLTLLICQKEGAIS